jgi:hypothetical protein
VPEAVAEGCSHRVSRSRFIEQVRVGADRDVRVRVAELRGDVDRIELEADDQQRRERVSERMGADPFAELGFLDSSLDLAADRTVIVAATIRGGKHKVVVA